MKFLSNFGAITKDRSESHSPNERVQKQLCQIENDNSFIENQGCAQPWLRVDLLAPVYNFIKPFFRKEIPKI